MFYILPEERRLRLRFSPVSDGTASDAPAFPIFPLSLHLLTLSIFTQSYILKVEVQEVQTQIYYSPTLQRVGILMLFSGKIKVEGTTQDVALLERANYFATIKKNSLIIRAAMRCVNIYSSKINVKKVILWKSTFLSTFLSRRTFLGFHSIFGALLEFTFLSGYTFLSSLF